MPMKQKEESRSEGSDADEADVASFGSTGPDLLHRYWLKRKQ